ncbi:MAG: SDR family oxidoreductase [Candidatus Micrarchaeia archaeon]|jgi:3-oxoacyl-[acyl-carrier protein] reductase
MTGEFEGKVVLVTGGSQGIGYAMADAFSKRGAKVTIFARNAAQVAQAAKELSCEGAALDVGDSQAVKKAFDSIAQKNGGIDVLVNCAGIYGPIGPIEGNDSGNWAQAMHINLCGTAFSCQAAIPHMKKRKSGCIINMAGGGVGGSKLKPNFSCYTTSKFGICGFTEALSKELEGTGVRVNAISPGAVNTRLLEEVLSAGAKAGKDFLEASKKQKQSGGTPPGAAAELALFLASEKAAHISGKVLSAVWDKKELLTLPSSGSPDIFVLRRIDNELYCGKK